MEKSRSFLNKILKEEPVELNEKSVNKCKDSLDSFDKDLIQCLKWTVAQSPNATNILFRRPKVAPNQVVTGPTKNIWANCLKDVKNCCFTETEHKLQLQRQITLLFQSKTVCYEHSDWSKYIFVANEYTANVIYCSPQLFIFIEPINTRFLHVFL